MSRIQDQTSFDKSKRAFDLFISLALIIATAPLQAGVAALVALKLGRPVLFRQERPGKDGEILELVKFRTMRNVDPSKGYVSNEQRMTPLGDKLRGWSLDELPSFWNIAKGELSLVGPRPLLPSYLPRYSTRQARRHEVRPGLTGLAQVSGRNALNWEDRFELDIHYVENRSWRLDLIIIGLTFKKVLSRDGVTSEGHVVGSPFEGNKEA